MMFQSRAFNYTMLAFPMMAFVGYGAGFWVPPYLLRVHDVSATQIGLYVGLGSALGGFIGITFGGVLADYLKARFPSGRMTLGYISTFGVIPLLLLLLYTESMTLAFWLNFFLTMPAACGASVPPTTASDLVMPRMRAVAGAYYILVNTFIGLALGPLAIGQLSDMLHHNGMSEAEALRSAIALSMLIFIPALFFLYLAQKHLPSDESSRLDRARSLGESVEAS